MAWLCLLHFGDICNFFARPSQQHIIKQNECKQLNNKTMVPAYCCTSSVLWQYFDDVFWQWLSCRKFLLGMCYNEDNDIRWCEYNYHPVARNHYQYSVFMVAPCMTHNDIIMYIYSQDNLCSNNIILLYSHLAQLLYIFYILLN